MSLDNIDEYLFNIFIIFSKNFEDCMKNTLDYKLNLTTDIVTGKKHFIEATDINTKKTKSVFIVLLGTYNKDNEEFKWFNNRNKMLRETIETSALKVQNTNLIDLFGSKKIIDKIFEPVIKINNKLHYAIPYFLSFLNNKLNLVRFENENGNIFMYALVQLDIKCELPYQDLWFEINFYKKMLITNAKLSRNKSIKSKKTKKSTSKKNNSITKKSKKSNSKKNKSKTKKSKKSNSKKNKSKTKKSKNKY